VISLANYSKYLVLGVSYFLKLGVGRTKADNYFKPRKSLNSRQEETMTSVPLSYRRLKDRTHNKIVILNSECNRPADFCGL